MIKRFIPYPNSQYVLDDLTGNIIKMNSNEVAKELNKLNSKNDELAELLYPFQLLMKKYEIDSVAKLDQMLMEQKVW